MSHRLIAISVLWCALICSVPAQSARMPRGSFLVQPARSAWQLKTQIESTPLVAARYEKHFGIPAAQFVRYIQSDLGLRRLKSTGDYKVFHVKKDGTIGSQIRRLRKGTAVFLHLRTGKPVLLAECGNPMSTTLPGYTAPTAQDTLPSVGEPSASAAPVTPVEEPPLPPPVSTLEPNGLEDPVLAQMQTAEIPLWEADQMLMLPDLPLSSAGSLAHLAVPSLPSPFVAGVGGITIAPSGGWSNGRGGTNPPPAVPEPASLVCWAAGLPLVAFHQRRKSETR